MKLGLTILAGAVAMIVGAGASATITATQLGTAAPPATVGSYTMTPFPLDPQPAGSAIVTGVASPLGGSVDFVVPNDHRRIGAGWATWSHGYTGDVYYNNGSAATSLIMPANTGAFYLYVEPNDFGGHTFGILATGSAGFLDAQIPGFVVGDSGAAGIAFTATGGGTIDRLDISNDDGSAGGFAIGEFAIALVPTPGVLALLGAAGLVSRRRRR